MSINFSQFPTPTLPINAGDFVVGYQNLGTGGVPTLAQYTMTQLFSGVFPGGTVPVSQGGTGQTTLIANGVLIGEGTSPVNSVVPGTTGTMLLSNGAGIDPSFGSNPVLNGATAVTQPRIDNTTLVATDAFVNQQIASSTANVPFPLVGGVYNQASLGTGASYVIFASGGVISSIITVINGGSGYAVGDLLLVIGGNYDAVLRVTNVSGGVIQSGGLSVIYGGTGYTTGSTTSSVPVPPGQRTVTFTGVLTSNVTFIIQNGTFLTASRRVEFNNNTTGAFTITVKLSNGAGGSVGTGVVLPQGTNNSTAVIVQTDGINDVWLSNTPLGIGALPAAANGRLLNVQVFAAGGTYTPTAGATRAVVEAMGAGGGSGGNPATAAGQNALSGAGNGAAFGRIYIASGLATQTVTIGAAGTAGAAGANPGGAGGNTSFGALLVAQGGAGGNAGTASATFPVFNFPPTPVAVCTGSGVFMVSGTGPNCEHGLLTAINGGWAGTGANTQWGTGGRGGLGAGVVAQGFGAGAGGSFNSASSAAQAGAAGAPGLLIVYEYS